MEYLNEACHKKWWTQLIIDFVYLSKLGFQTVMIDTLKCCQRYGVQNNMQL